MSSATSIEWTDRTWNPLVGCQVVSPGCAHCYATVMAARIANAAQAARRAGKTLTETQAAYRRVVMWERGGMDAAYEHDKALPKWNGRVVPLESALLEPLSWRTPARVFVNSMSNLFHEAVPDAFIDKVFEVMALARRHTFRVPPKRADRMREYVSVQRREHVAAAVLRVPGIDEGRRIAVAVAVADGLSLDEDVPAQPRWPLPNVWLGVSVENQKFADERIPLLLQTPAAVRFISAEPLLGPIRLDHVPIETRKGDDFRPGAGLDWVIVGGESGPGARPFDLAWARSIVQQCQASGVPVFFKQAGAVPLVPAGRQTHWDYRFVKRPEEKRFVEHDGKHWRMRLLDKKGGDPAEWPEDLRVREIPVKRS